MTDLTAAELEQEEKALIADITIAERNQVRHDAQAARWADEAAAHPIDELCRSLKERIAAQRVELDSLEAEIDLRRGAYHNGLTETMSFAREAMTQLTALPRVASALKAVISAIPDHPSPTAREPALEPAAETADGNEPPVARIATPNPDPHPGALVGEDAPEFLRRSTMGRRLRGLTVLAIGAALFGLMFAPTALARHKHAHLPRIQPYADRYIPPAKPLPARPATAMAFNPNPHGDPSWFAPIPVGRIDDAFLLLMEPKR